MFCACACACIGHCCRQEADDALVDILLLQSPPDTIRILVEEDLRPDPLFVAVVSMDLPVVAPNVGAVAWVFSHCARRMPDPNSFCEVLALFVSGVARGVACAFTYTDFFCWITWTLLDGRGLNVAWRSASCDYRGT